MRITVGSPVANNNWLWNHLCNVIFGVEFATWRDSFIRNPCFPAQFRGNNALNKIAGALTRLTPVPCGLSSIGVTEFHLVR